MKWGKWAIARVVCWLFIYPGTMHRPCGHVSATSGTITWPLPMTTHIKNATSHILPHPHHHLQHLASASQHQPSTTIINGCHSQLYQPPTITLTHPNSTRTMWLCHITSQAWNKHPLHQHNTMRNMLSLPSVALLCADPGESPYPSPHSSNHISSRCHIANSSMAIKWQTSDRYDIMDNTTITQHTNDTTITQHIYDTT